MYTYSAHVQIYLDIITFILEYILLDIFLSFHLWFLFLFAGLKISTCLTAWGKKNCLLGKWILAKPSSKPHIICFENKYFCKLGKLKFCILSALVYEWIIMVTHWGRDKMAATLADNTFKCISLNEKFWILHKFSQEYVTWGLIDSMAAWVQVMAWCRTGDKSLSEPMLVCGAGTCMHHSASC